MTKYAIDLRQTIITFSLLQIINQFKRMRTGEAMEISGVEKNIIPDLKSVLPPGTYELTDTGTVPDDSPYLRLRLKKIKTISNHQIKGDPSCQKSI
jgi:hypothetical protein